MKRILLLLSTVSAISASRMCSSTSGYTPGYTPDGPCMEREYSTDSIVSAPNSPLTDPDKRSFSTKPQLHTPDHTPETLNISDTSLNISGTSGLGPITPIVSLDNLVGGAKKGGETGGSSTLPSSRSTPNVTTRDRGYLVVNVPNGPSLQNNRSNDEPSDGVNITLAQIAHTQAKPSPLSTDSSTLADTATTPSHLKLPLFSAVPVTNPESATPYKEFDEQSDSEMGPSRSGSQLHSLRDQNLLPDQNLLSPDQSLLSPEQSFWIPGTSGKQTSENQKREIIPFNSVVMPWQTLVKKPNGEEPHSIADFAVALFR